MKLKNAIHLFMVSVALGALLTGCFENPNATEEVCNNTCQYAFDGECDDGGPNSQYSLCDCGTDCADCGTREVSDNDCLGGGSSSSSSSGSGSSGSSSSGGSSSSSSGSSSSSSGSSSSGSSSSSSGGSSSSSSSGGVTYLPTGTVHLVFNSNYRYSGTTHVKTGPVEAPWVTPGTLTLVPYTTHSCPPVGLGLGGSDMTITNVVYYRYSLNRCGANPVDHYENTFMPAYQGQTVTFYIGP